MCSYACAGEDLLYNSSEYFQGVGQRARERECHWVSMKEDLFASVKERTKQTDGRVAWCKRA